MVKEKKVKKTNKKEIEQTIKIEDTDSALIADDNKIEAIEICMVCWWSWKVIIDQSNNWLNKINFWEERKVCHLPIRMKWNDKKSYIICVDCYIKAFKQILWEPKYFKDLENFKEN